MKVNSKQAIISILKESSEPISGESISSKIGISRTAVWKNIKRLTTEGYTITSSTKGYLLKKESDLLLSYEFETNRELYTYEESASSTMDLAKELIDCGKAKNGSVIIAGDQTSTRSKKTFDSPKGGLYFTLIIFPSCPIMDINLYPMAATISVKEILSSKLGIQADIMWPFESWVGDRKVSGVIHDYKVENNKISWVNLGIGINLESDIPRRELLVEIRGKIFNLLENRDDLVEIYAKNLHRNKEYNFNIEGKTFTGKIKDVDRLGTLTVETDTTTEFAYIGNSEQRNIK